MADHKTIDDVAVIGKSGLPPREDPQSDNYYVHTSCARVALFLSYESLSCAPCREYYERIITKRHAEKQQSP